MHNLNDMVAFARVVEEGGFTAAAKRTGLPKSNLSRRVLRLEQTLGVRLLERTTRQMHKTEIGNLYYQHCKRIIEEAEHAEDCLDSLSTHPRGLIRVSASITFGQNLLSPVMAEFLEQFPEITMQLTLSNRRVDLIEEGFDIAIRMGDLEDSSLVVRKIGASETCLYASPNYLKDNGALHTPKDLSTHRYLAMSSWVAPGQITLIGSANTVSVDIKPQVIINDFESLRQLAVDHGGIASLPDYVARSDLRSNKLVRALPEWSSKFVPVSVVFPSHRGATPKVRAFIDFLSDKVQAAVG